MKYAAPKVNLSANNNGFTLIEVFIAMLVLMIALLGMAGMAGNVIQANIFSRQMTTATSLAEDKMEELMNTLSAGGNDTITVSNHDFTRTWVVAQDTPLPNLVQVTVRVTFLWRENERNVELQTIMR